MAGDKIICHCKQVSYIDIRKAMIAGARTVQEIKDMTGAATGCGRCVGEIEKILASVCGCKGVSLEDVVNAVKKGAETTEKVAEKLAQSIWSLAHTSCSTRRSSSRISVCSSWTRNSGSASGTRKRSRK